jgi:hypothetical protein
VSSNPAADYAQLLKAAYPAAKAGDSSVPVLAASLAGADVAFLAQLYQDGIQGYYDGISMHPYCDSNPPGAAPAGGDTRYEFEAGLEAIHELQLQHGDNTPIWVTEFGWDTVDTSEQDQAAYIEQGYQILAGMPYVKAGIVYELHDDIGGAATDPEANYGLLTQNYAAKPAYAAFTSVMTAPAAPVLNPPTGGIVVNDAGAALSFTAATDSTVAVDVDGTLAGTATADDGGNATFTLPDPLADGQHSVDAVDTDPYGNVGSASPSSTFTLVPSAPVIVSPLSGAASTATVSPAVSGAPGDTATICIDSLPCSTSSLNSQGLATVGVTNLSPGSHSVVARQTDRQGLESPDSPTVSWTVSPSSPKAAAVPVARAAARTALVLRLSGRRGRVLRVTCSAIDAAIKRCLVAVFIHGRRAGAGSVRFHRSGVRSGVVRVRLNSLGNAYERALKGPLAVTITASAQSSSGDTLRASRLISLA